MSEVPSGRHSLCNPGMGANSRARYDRRYGDWLDAVRLRSIFSIIRVAFSFSGLSWSELLILPGEIEAFHIQVTLLAAAGNW